MTTYTDMVLAHLKATPAGGPADEIAALLKANIDRITNAVSYMLKTGRIAAIHEPKGKAYQRKRYFAVEHAPKEAIRGTFVQPGRASAKKPAPKLKASLKALPSIGRFNPDVKREPVEVIVPANVKVTIAPPFVDRRFTFDPPPGWKGQITQDWRERRMQEHK